MYQSVRAVVDELTEDGMKVIAVAYKKTAADTIERDAADFTLLGYLAFFDPPKASAAEAIERLKKLKVDVRILTGDDIKTTVSVCSRLGVDTSAVLTGGELLKISENDLPIRVENTRVFAELTPRQKSEIVEILQKNGHCVGFMGDGMNDLPAELKANVGISVDTAAETVKEGADIILLKKGFKRIGAWHNRGTARVREYDQVHQNHRLVQFREHLRGGRGKYFSAVFADDIIAAAPFEFAL